MTRIKFTPPLKNGINQYEMVIMGWLSHVSTCKHEGIQDQLEKKDGNNDGQYKTHSILFWEFSA